MKSGYFTIMWNGRDCGDKQNEPPPIGQSSSKEEDAVFMVGLEGSPLL